jgi:hypothetical protein
LSSAGAAAAGGAAAGAAGAAASSFLPQAANRAAMEIANMTFFMLDPLKNWKFDSTA